MPGPKIRNPRLLVLLCAMLFALGSSAEAQQPKKVPRIGYLSALSPFFRLQMELLKEIMPRLSHKGYVDGDLAPRGKKNT